MPISTVHQDHEHLKTNIRQVIAEIPPIMCQQVVENYLKTMNACTTSRVGHLIDVSVQTLQ